ncbi:Transcription-silencing protein, cryptic loci regulator Clr2 [Ceratobasidium sp. AG-Ba]|nr:Transcription-silencing protein, cryptic loci regulator Clr2 [Ceratobasidium sp. AG-Ba]QRW02993.1 Transcription-silencing protein, cryptic loci regulator Clr2 [Ceratobasidium sp. AG-Ba]
MVSGAQIFKDTGQIGPKVSNGQMLEWLTSDGDKSRRPPVSFKKEVDSEGNVNYYREVPDTEEASVTWRREIGTHIAKKLGYPSGKVYWMRGWPSGYGFYDHQKGKLPNPRHDLYLCGSASTLRFRSKNEFLPHALWLMTDPASKQVCQCKYCSKTKSQVEVNQTLGLPGLRHAPEGHAKAPTKVKVLAPSMTHASRRAAREKMARDKAEKDQATKRTDQPGPAGALPERIRDLTASGRAFRGLELVWVVLKNPIYLKPDKSVAIDFWPAIVHSFSTKNTPSSHKPGDPNYTIQCQNMFTVRLLAVNHEIRVSEDRLLPQLGYGPGMALLDMIRECGPSRPLSLNFEEYMDFNPLSEYNKDLGISPSQYTSQDALPAFTLALHIVACLTPMWCVTHSYINDDAKSKEEAYYQGIWWGSERIWLDDLVRLRPSREEVDPGNQLGLLPPSSPDALNRALFLRITYIVADPGDPSETGICVGGDLYELALESEQSKPASKIQPNAGSSSMFGPPTGLLGGPWPQSQSSPAGTARSQLPFLNNADPSRDTFGQDQRGHGQGPAASSSKSVALPPPVVETVIPLPDPPAGYAFRRLLKPGNEMVVDVGAIAGRYYPSILQMETVDAALRSIKEQSTQATKRRRLMDSGQGQSHQLGTIEAYARSRLNRRMNDDDEEVYEGAGRELTSLLALAGLIPGDGNSMQPEQWVKGRLATIQGAERNGRDVLYNQWKARGKGASSDIEMLEG